MASRSKWLWKNLPFRVGLADTAIQPGRSVFMSKHDISWAPVPNLSICLSCGVCLTSLEVACCAGRPLLRAGNSSLWSARLAQGRALQCHGSGGFRGSLEFFWCPQNYRQILSQVFGKMHQDCCAEQPRWVEVALLESSLIQQSSCTTSADRVTSFCVCKAMAYVHCESPAVIRPK